MHKPLIVLDGPAGVGKTTTARELARRLGIPYLDTGGMYRTLTVAVIRKGVDPANDASIRDLLDKTDFRFATGSKGINVWIDGEDVTDELRTEKTTRSVSNVCEAPEVRKYLVKMQRDWALRGFGVLEGRDMGTVVFPNAGLKIYLTARPEVRALRRSRDMGIDPDDKKAINRLAKEIQKRDKRDMSRQEAPLKQAEDAVVLDNGDLTFEQQVDEILKLAAQRFRIKFYG